MWYKLRRHLVPVLLLSESVKGVEYHVHRGVETSDVARKLSQLLVGTRGCKGSETGLGELGFKIYSSSRCHSVEGIALRVKECRWC